MPKKNSKNIWDKPEVLEKAELMRQKRHKNNPRQTFDCFHAHARADRVICIAGHKLNSTTKDGSMNLVSVLRGRTSSQCKTCPDFDGDYEREESKND